MAASPISYVGNAQGAADSNPTSGNFTVHANTRAGDLVIAQWYSRASTKKFPGAPIETGQPPKQEEES